MSISKTIYGQRNSVKIVLKIFLNEGDDCRLGENDFCIFEKDEKDERSLFSRKFNGGFIVIIALDDFLLGTICVSFVRVLLQAVFSHLVQAVSLPLDCHCRSYEELEASMLFVKNIKVITL
jgi:hypothetical protein